MLQLQPGAAGFQLSNPPVLQMMCLLGSLNVFKMTSMTQLTKKSRILTTYLELLLEDINETFASKCTNIFPLFELEVYVLLFNCVIHTKIKTYHTV